jgi:hypothetical protein
VVQPSGPERESKQGSTRARAKTPWPSRGGCPIEFAAQFKQQAFCGFFADAGDFEVLSGIPAFACTPDMIAATLRREDIAAWAARAENQGDG